MTRLILTRHGETEWNLSGLVQGNLDSPLTAKGINQAHQLAARLSKEKISAVFSSPAGRALTTAQIVAAELHVPVLTCPEFREISFGDWEGKAWTKLKQADPNGFAEWETTPYRYRFPQGETMEEVLLRVRPKVLGLCQEHQNETICVVSHGITLKVLVTSLMGLTLADWQQTPWQFNTAVNIFEVDGPNCSGLVLGDCSHISE